MVRFLLKLNRWVIFFTLLSYVSPFISPEQMSFMAFLGLAYPWLLLLNVVFVFLWATSRMRYWWYSALTVLLGGYYLTTIVGLNFFQSEKKGDIKVLTYNILSTKRVKDKDTPKLRAFIDSINCDIICFQEFAHYQELEERVSSALSKFPYRQYPIDSKMLDYYTPNSMLSIYSKYPIISGGSIPFEPYNGANGYIYADIQIKDKIIRFYNIHLNSNLVTSVVDSQVEIREEKKMIKKIYLILKKMRYTAQMRGKQAEYLKKHMKQSPYPVVICGDFNTIPVSYPYRVIKENLIDAFQQSGKGYAQTYRERVPALKIDNIFVDKKIKTSNTEVLKVNFSDHYPMVTELSF
jgi:endonuclease/exonuclease/phosphatase family metal-dependent hydrolase